ncbi:MAG: NADH-quinone oxidoreductase subunit NuoE [Alphaproteobacteria bacterium HGW-Alphaproteobacteria-4]|nr:MAG: NADH-quinone oxidoreductase subunit NuoE [Alphaproteobacteria bacterium HGW-Alphaproteobacteria-4]
MLRRLHAEQPESFAFTPANLVWADAQITKYPAGRQASAIIPLLWRAQEQEGWLTKPAIEYVADKLGMAYIRALEVATFYFMFQLQPVGSVAHIQICGTTSCMICGAENLYAVCREKIAPTPHTLSADGKFSWEEVECLGACANAPMAQIGKDYYEDLTAESFAKILDDLAAGKVPTPGSQTGRYAAEPASGLTSLTDGAAGKPAHNATVSRALELNDTVKRIDGSEVPVLTPWLAGPKAATKPAVKAAAPVAVAPAAPAKPAAAVPGTASTAVAAKPAALAVARGGKADDLKLIKGVGPKMEALLNRLGFFHYDQIAGWSAAELAWVDDNLEGFKGRASRDGWVEQAKLLATGAETEFAARARKEGIYDKDK